MISAISHTPLDLSTISVSLSSWNCAQSSNTYPPHTRKINNFLFRFVRYIRQCTLRVMNGFQASHVCIDTHSTNSIVHLSQNVKTKWKELRTASYIWIFGKLWNFIALCIWQTIDFRCQIHQATCGDVLFLLLFLMLHPPSSMIKSPEFPRPR